MGDSTKHAELSPSKRHRWAACPGSIREEAKHPEPPAGPAAADGTRTHALLEELITGGPDGKGRAPLRAPQMLVGTSRTDEYGTYTIDQDRIDRVNVAIDYIRAHPNACHAIAEQRVYPDGLVGRADLHGTVDCQIPGDPYEIIDYKDGMAPVEAEWNPQLVQYALGALAGMDPDKYPKKVRLTVIQPKLAVKGMPPITSWEVPTLELLDHAEVIKAQADATDDPNAPLVPGEAQCKYCRAKATCPALTGMVSDMFGPVTSVVTAPDLAVNAANKDPDKMTGEELRKFLDAAPLIENLLKSVREEAYRRLNAGTAVPGFKLVRGNSSRDWALSEEEMVKKLGPGGMNIPKGSLYVTKFISPAQAEKLVWESKGEPKKLSDIQKKRMQSEYVTSSPGKPTLVPESDPRPAITTDASDLFGSTTVEVVPQPAPLPAFFFSPSIPAAPVEVPALPSFFK